MHDDLMNLLDRRRDIGVCGDRIIGDVREGIGRGTGERPHDETAVARGIDCAQHIVACPRRADREQDVVGTAVRAHLPREHILPSVIVGNRSDARGLRMQCERAVRLPFDAVPPDQLGREVLRVRGAAAVAHREQPMPASERESQAITHALDATTVEAIERAA